MAEPKILRIEKGDSQKALIDKLNINFSELSFYGGGFLGSPGDRGIKGQLGLKGIGGSFGNPGIRGFKWTVSEENPESPINEDFWIQSYLDPNLNKTYRYKDGNWNSYEYDIARKNLFSKIYPINRNSESSISNTGIYISVKPFFKSNLVLSSTGYSEEKYNELSSKIFIEKGTNVGAFSDFGDIIAFHKNDYMDSDSPSIRFPSRSGPLGPLSLWIKFLGDSEFISGKDVEISSSKGSLYFLSNGINIKSRNPNYPLIIRTFPSDYKLKKPVSARFDGNQAFDLIGTSKITYNTDTDLTVYGNLAINNIVTTKGNTNTMLAQ